MGHKWYRKQPFNMTCLPFCFFYINNFYKVRKSITTTAATTTIISKNFSQTTPCSHIGKTYFQLFQRFQLSKTDFRLKDIYIYIQLLDIMLYLIFAWASANRISASNWRGYAETAPRLLPAFLISTTWKPNQGIE